MCGATSYTPLLPTSFQRNFSHAKGQHVSWTLILRCSFNCGEKAGTVENELATLIPDLRSLFAEWRGSSVEPRVICCGLPLEATPS